MKDDDSMETRMQLFFEGMTDEQILNARYLPAQMSIRPSIALSAVTSPVTMHWYQSLEDKRTAGATIAHFLEKGLREALYIQTPALSLASPTANPAATLAPSPANSAPPPPVSQPESERISLATALAMMP